MRNASDSDEHFERWIARLEARHLADLRFSEVSRALRALSSTYVERRGRIAEGAALSGSGKRAAFAIFYGPLHFLLLREIVLRLPAATDVAPTLIDLGCGTGASAAAWATICPHRPAVVGIDRHRWALEESAQTFRDFELSARTRLADIATAPMPNGRARSSRPSPSTNWPTKRATPSSAACSIARRAEIRFSSWSRWPVLWRHGGADGPRRFRPPAGARTSGGFACRCRRSSRSSIAPPASITAS